ncbi:MAG: hypothetical protein HY751_07945 [Nitrospinae bacterium]|nr:hypothetical protein [Nitrospinota bacterium]
MPRFIYALFIAVTLIISAGSSLAATSLQPYLIMGELKGSMAEAEKAVGEALASGGFSVIGAYSPASDPKLRAIVFTRDDISSALGGLAPTRMLAAALKVGLKQGPGGVTVTIVNPEYLFRAYTQKEYSKAERALSKVHNDVLAAFKPDAGFSAKPAPMGGGGLAVKDLEHYHYMIGMEYFEDMSTLNDKPSTFEELTAKIEKRLAEKAGGAEKVYSIKPAGKNVAVYGVALTDTKMGERFFLPIIGTDHVAAMPYELIVVDKKAYCLYGRYRIALHWPALTMGTFTKIISTPGEIVDQLKSLVK